MGSTHCSVEPIGFTPTRVKCHTATIISKSSMLHRTTQTMHTTPATNKQTNKQCSQSSKKDLKIEEEQNAYIEIRFWHNFFCLSFGQKLCPNSTVSVRQTLSDWSTVGRELPGQLKIATSKHNKYHTTERTQWVLPIFLDDFVLLCKVIYLYVTSLLPREW